MKTVPVRAGTNVRGPYTQLVVGVAQTSVLRRRGAFDRHRTPRNGNRAYDTLQCARLNKNRAVLRRYCGVNELGADHEKPRCQERPNTEPLTRAFSESRQAYTTSLAVRAGSLFPESLAHLSQLAEIPSAVVPPINPPPNKRVRLRAYHALVLWMAFDHA